MTDHTTDSTALSTNGTGADEPVRRGPGRPRRSIAMSDVADVAVQLFSEGGYDAVSIEAAAERLSVSRATLYRTVSTKDDLLGIVLERLTHELSEGATELMESTDDPEEALLGLLRLQIDAAIKTRRYLAVLFGGVGLAPEAYARWQEWSRDYEALWTTAVTRAMKADVLQWSDPRITTRLLLGMAIWVSRWFRPTEGFTADEIAEAAVQLISSHRAT
ncbi:TetR/AcrR family transcriptional regulator [Rhodococcus sp. IEGM 1305]|uniref:TetR/AcrR family transcriptional regulator n=1 Tax=Rhodococcus sp. IEGM 1305 TaxID=3047092 RepID=UPI0024B7707D|nr:TetR/AcrR family transcriptional regulator [Rhodococcus sp. IEGM 1305]MDI9953289.1 TetR/AcrR family transcriptional regulator [Rhodococcus sp. IEGM 1305]